MKNRIASFIGLALLLAAVSAPAQVTQTVQVKVAFPFVVAGMTMPPATYRIQIVRSSGSELVTLLTPAGVALATLQASSDDRPGEAGRNYLRFQRAGESWILQGVTANGKAKLLTMAKSESELARLVPARQQTLTASVAGAH
ncbi:MAG: hypothetical protein WCE75_00850 [Terracidiphilus sp.]